MIGADLKRRSAREWIVRMALAGAATALGIIGTTHSLALAQRTSDSPRAFALAPWDGRLAAAFAQTLSDVEATPAMRHRADGIARGALENDPTAVAAAATLGVNAQVRGDSRQAARMFGYAQTLSRRDLQTQLWMIEAAVARGDISGALHHYDRALRTSSRAADLLFPVLTSAIGDATVRQAVAGTIATRPSWAPLFLEYAAGNGPAPQAVSALFADLARGGYPVSAISRTLLTDTLAARGLFDDAWRVYAASRPAVDRAVSRDPDLTQDADHATIFDWRSVGEGGRNATVGGGLIDFSTAPGVGGTLVQQMQLLPPGAYRIDGHSIGIDQPVQTAPFWQLTCRGGADIGRLPISNSATAGGRFSGRFVVPSGCPVQTLSLVAEASDSIGGVSGQIDQVQVRPAR